jgi:hypothetical protein
MNVMGFIANISDERVECTRTRRGPCGDSSLRYLLITQLLLLTSVAFAGDKPASCELAGKSVVSRSSSGLAQVSNLGLIEITCSVQARPFSTEAGESRSLLKVATVAYQILPDGSKKLVPSETNQTGGGGSNTEAESVYITFHVPLGSADLDAEANRIVAWVEKSMPSEQITEESHRALERIRKFVGEHRVGHFQVECRILDGDRVMGVAVVELEVLFKGHFSDIGLQASPPV